MFQNVEEVFDTRREKQRLRRNRAEARSGDAEQRTIRGEAVTVHPVPELDRYMYDLQGFLVIKGAVGAEELRAMNAFHDAKNGGLEAQGLSAAEAQAMMADPHSLDGKDQQQGFMGPMACKGIGGDPCFDGLIAHPSWADHIRDFVNGDDTVMTPGGGSVGNRWPGQASGVHGGGMQNAGGGTGTRNRTFEWLDGEEEGEAGRFHSKVVSVLLSLNDCPAGGGNTAVVVSIAQPLLCWPWRCPHLTGGVRAVQPGSHKSNLRHPYQDPEAGQPQLLWRVEEPQPLRHGSKTGEGGYMDGVPGAVELTAEAGDAPLLC